MQQFKQAFLADAVAARPRMTHVLAVCDAAAAFILLVGLALGGLLLLVCVYTLLPIQTRWHFSLLRTKRYV